MLRNAYSLRQNGIQEIKKAVKLGVGESSEEAQEARVAGRHKARRHEPKGEW